MALTLFFQIIESCLCVWSQPVSVLGTQSHKIVLVLVSALSGNTALLNNGPNWEWVIGFFPSGYGVVTDVETSYTARIILITLVPFLILQLAMMFHSSSAKRIVILIALIITVVFAGCLHFYQIFQPWIQKQEI
ncbi:Sodium/calcium exchanger NCL1 [Sesamum alatum]|uniref:Sodium/calcium exchanger NCL1 n=1 Tax=Sesamum alatum TaxID=300844 RepID=A0AAE1Y0Z1_9LAMI|nr:Sodium/calcium exchanger NCL1 [Sesamum alatum]